MAPRLPSDGQILGVDYGLAKTGLALAGAVAKLPKPYKIVKTEEIISELAKIIKSEDIKLIVIGLPRSLEGNETAQSKQTRQFADQLRARVDKEICFADETLSSVRAEQYLKDNKISGEAVDSIAACFILEEFFKSNGADATNRHG